MTKDLRLLAQFVPRGQAWFSRVFKTSVNLGPAGREQKYERAARGHTPKLNPVAHFVKQMFCGGDSALSQRISEDPSSL